MQFIFRNGDNSQKLPRKKNQHARLRLTRRRDEVPSLGPPVAIVPHRHIAVPCRRHVLVVCSDPVSPVDRRHGKSTSGDRSRAGVLQSSAAADQGWIRASSVPQCLFQRPQPLTLENLRFPTQLPSRMSSYFQCPGAFRRFVISTSEIVLPCFLTAFIIHSTSSGLQSTSSGNSRLSWATHHGASDNFNPELFWK